jgi:hypothetical protein
MDLSEFLVVYTQFALRALRHVDGSEFADAGLPFADAGLGF